MASKQHLPGEAGCCLPPFAGFPDHYPWLIQIVAYPNKSKSKLNKGGALSEEDDHGSHSRPFTCEDTQGKFNTLTDCILTGDKQGQVSTLIHDPKDCLDMEIRAQYFP